MPTAAREEKMSSESYRREGLGWLGLSEEPAPGPRVAPILTRAGIRLGEVLDHLSVAEEPEARAVVEAAAKLPDRFLDAVTIDDVCAAAGVQPQVILGILVKTVAESTLAASNLVASLVHPEIVRASIESAKEPGPRGFRDRQMLLQKSGFAPMPKTQVVQMFGGQRIQAGQTQVAVLVPAERAAREMADRFNERLQLAAPVEPAEDAEWEEVAEDKGD